MGLIQKNWCLDVSHPLYNKRNDFYNWQLWMRIFVIITYKRFPKLDFERTLKTFAQIGLWFWIDMSISNFFCIHPILKIDFCYSDVLEWMTKNIPFCDPKQVLDTWNDFNTLDIFHSMDCLCKFVFRKNAAT